MSFVEFLYKGERPKSKTETELEESNQRLAQRLATLETEMASQRAAARPAEAPPVTLPTGAPAAAALPSYDLQETTQSVMPASGVAQGRFKIAVFIAYAMTAFAIIDLIGIIILLIIGRDVPDFMQLTLSGIVGYFGGALSAYMGVQG